MTKKTERRGTKTTGCKIRHAAGSFLTDQERRTELADAHKQALAELNTVDTALHLIQSMDVQKATTLKGILGNGFIEDRWQTPRKWMPLGHYAQLDIDLRSRICSFMEAKHKKIVREADAACSAGIKAAQAGNAEPLPNASSHVNRVLDGAILGMTRFLLLCRLGPSGVGKRAKHRPLDVTSLSKIAYSALPILMAIAVSKLLDNSGKGLASTDAVGYFSLVQRKDLERFSKYLQTRALIEIERMKMLSEMGLWADAPILDVPLQTVTVPSGASVQPRPAKTRKPHLPLPDDYVAEMGKKTLWIIQELGPNLLDVANEIMLLWRSTASPTVKKQSLSCRRTGAVKKFLKKYVWRERTGTTIESPPFALRLNSQADTKSRLLTKAKAATTLQVDDFEDDGSEDVAAATEAEPVELLSWPPRNYAQIVALWGVLQRAHLFVVGMAEGPRSGEVLTLQRDCVEYAVNGMPYSSGLTFKLTERFDGELRDWVLPSVAVQAIEQQSRLIRLIEPIGEMTPASRRHVQSKVSDETELHLWGQIGGSAGAVTASVPLIAARPALIGYAKALDMSTNPGGQNFRFHRFRKTLARIAAIALTDSAKILMDVFGHKDIEMTMYYILADKDLQADIQKVSRELQVMRAGDAIETMVAAEEAYDAMRKAAWIPGTSSVPAPIPVNGGFGGGAAPHLAHAIKKHRERVHKHARDWGAQTVNELAERFTAMGMAWDYVRPGVMCIKRHTQVGSCTHKIGKRDVSNCKTDCDYHLVHPSERESVEGSIRDCLRYYNEAGKEGNDWMQEVWAAQITAHLSTFDDLRAKWMDDPTVRRLVKEQDIDGVQA